jgi:hypothetical protein
VRKTSQGEENTTFENEISKKQPRPQIPSAQWAKGWFGDFDIAEPAPNDYGTVK